MSLCSFCPLVVTVLNVIRCVQSLCVTTLYTNNNLCTLKNNKIINFVWTYNLWELRVHSAIETTHVNIKYSWVAAVNSANLHKRRGRVRQSGLVGQAILFKINSDLKFKCQMLQWKSRFKVRLKQFCLESSKFASSWSS